MKTKTKKGAKKTAPKKKTEWYRRDGFEVKGSVVTYKDVVVGEFENFHFRPNDEGDKMGLCFMEVTEAKNCLTYLINQLANIKNPPVKKFYKKVADA